MFEEKLAEISGDPTECWVWLWCKDRAGYGRTILHKKQMLAHRAAYEILVGPIPAGLVIDHLCRNSSCVNPNHLEPVTDRVNILRGKGPSAKNALKTHCLHGHEFTPENTGVVKGGRRCRTCHTNRQKAYWNDPDTRKKINLRQQQIRSNPEIVKRISEYNRAYYLRRVKKSSAMESNA